MAEETLPSGKRVRDRGDGLRMIRDPGKLRGELLLTDYLYIAYLDGGADEEAGSSANTGWAGRMNPPFKPDYFAKIAKEEKDGPLTGPEEKFLRAAKGAILFESRDGFLSATWYSGKRGKAEFKRDWLRVVRDLEPDEEEEEEEEEE